MIIIGREREGGKDMPTFLSNFNSSTLVPWPLSFMLFLLSDSTFFYIQQIFLLQ